MQCWTNHKYFKKICKQNWYQPCECDLHNSWTVCRNIASQSTKHHIKLSILSKSSRSFRSLSVVLILKLDISLLVVYILAFYDCSVVLWKRPQAWHPIKYSSTAGRRLVQGLAEVKRWFGRLKLIQGLVCGINNGKPT